MIWVIKAGKNDWSPRDEDAPEYLSSWCYGAHNQLTDINWTRYQQFAFRFADRNAAAKMCLTFPINAYSSDVRLVQLMPKKKAAIAEPVCSRGLHTVFFKGERLFVEDGTVEALAAELVRLQPLQGICHRCGLPMVRVDDDNGESYMACPGVCDVQGVLPKETI